MNEITFICASCSNEIDQFSGETDYCDECKKLLAEFEEKENNE